MGNQLKSLRQLYILQNSDYTVVEFIFDSFLPSDSGVGLVNQRDGDIQKVVGEIVLGIGAKRNKDQWKWIFRLQLFV